MLQQQAQAESFRDVHGEGTIREQERRSGGEQSSSVYNAQFAGTTGAPPGGQLYQELQEINDYAEKNTALSRAVTTNLARPKSSQI